MERYGDRIGNFGGADVDVLCQSTEAEVREYVTDILKKCEGRGGVAFGSGNSIAGYVPVENYLAMVRAVREYRGEK